MIMMKRATINSCNINSNNIYNNSSGINFNDVYYDYKFSPLTIQERAKSIRNKVLIWFNQVSRGIKEMLSYAHTGIREWQDIETRNKYK